MNINQEAINAIIAELKEYKGIFILDKCVYDDILYCNNDNIYFSYGFNYLSGKAIYEDLIIIENIIKISNNLYILNKDTPTEVSLELRSL